MNKLVKKSPLTPEKIAEIKAINPDLYTDMVERYGEEAVTNNYLVKFNIFTEGKNVIGSDGTVYNITRDVTDFGVEPIQLGLQQIYQATKWKWMDYIKHGVNRVKSKFRDTAKDELGYIPMMTNHKDIVENRHGWLAGESLRLEEIEGHLCLTGDVLLVSPLSKYNWLIGLWDEVSPTFRGLAISELSFVPEPAQLTNSSFNLGENMKNNLENSNLILSNLDKSDIISQLEAAKYAAELEEQNNKLLQHQALVDGSLSSLVAGKVISSGSAANVRSELMSFSIGDVQKVARVIKNIRSSKYDPFLNQPQTVALEGNTAIMKTKDQHYLEFVQANPLIKDNNEMSTKFEAYYADIVKTSSFNAGAGQIKDPKQALADALELVKASGLKEDPEIAKLIAEAGVVKAPAEPAQQEPAPASFSAANQTTNAMDAYKQLLESGVGELLKENEALKSRLSKIEQTITGV